MWKNVKEWEGVAAANPAYVSSFYSISESIKMKPFKKKMYKTHERKVETEKFIYSIKIHSQKIRKYMYYIVEFFLCVIPCAKF